MSQWIASGSENPADGAGSHNGHGAHQSTRAELLASPGWHTALAQFARATELVVTLYDMHGELRAGPFAPSPLGQRLLGSNGWSTKSGICLRADADAVHECISKGAIVHQSGLGMLALFAIPVRLGNELIGSVAAGWVFDNFPDPVFTDRLARTFNVSFPELWQIVRQQPPVGPEKLGTYAELLQTLCDLFVRERAETLLEQEQSRNLRALFLSAQRLAAASSMEAIGEAIVEAVTTLTNVDGVRLLVPDDQGVWRTAAAHGILGDLEQSGMATYPRSITTSLRIPVEAADGSLLGIIETSDVENFNEPKRRTQIAALAAQTAVALHKSRLINDLQRERTSLERANRIKDEFLATLSHELRTPLTPILSWVMILNETPPEDTQLYTAGLEAIERNAKQELHLVEEMLDLTRILNDKVVLEPVTVNPNEAIAAAFSLAQSLCGERNLQLRMETGQDIPMITADERRLQQILSNLVSNAVKFTPDGGFVVIGARRAGDMVELFVTDSGMGISPEMLPYVFDRFRQADSSTRRRHGGLGIGLSIVRGLVELHGGKISATSEGDGQGATFIVSMPVVASEAPPAKRTRTGIYDLPPTGEGYARHEGKVLIVDDAIDTLISIKMLVQRSGLEVETANSVATAIETARRFTPDIIITDLGMPEQDGFDLLRIVRNDRELSSIPVVALTGFATMHDREAALAAGFAAHLPKPVEFSVLLGVIDGILRKVRKPDMLPRS